MPRQAAGRLHGTALPNNNPESNAWWKEQTKDLYVATGVNELGMMNNMIIHQYIMIKQAKTWFSISLNIFQANQEFSFKSMFSQKKSLKQFPSGNYLAVFEFKTAKEASFSTLF